MPKKGKYFSVKHRDSSSERNKYRSSRRSYTKSRQSRNRNKLIRDKRIQVKHIMIRGHGSFPPTQVSFHSKDKPKPYSGHTNIGDIPLLKQGVEIDPKLTDNSLIVTGTIPGSEGVVLLDPSISFTFFKKIKQSIKGNNQKSIYDICKDLNIHKDPGSHSTRETDVKWAQYADEQPVDFHYSRDNITVYFHDEDAGFYTGIYDIDGCKMNLDKKTFSDLENSQCNISEKVFNELSNYNEIYEDYQIEKIDDPNSVPRNNYLMKTIKSDLTTIKTEDGVKYRALSVPLKYLEDIIRKLYKNSKLEIRFYSTICKSTFHDKSVNSKVYKTKHKSDRNEMFSVDVATSMFDSMSLNRAAKKKRKKRTKRKKKRKK